jgi:hypothetical protein
VIDALKPDKIRAFLYGVLSLGWRFNRHWHRYEAAYLILAGHLDAAGALGALDRVVRLRDLGPARLAHDDLPAVLRRGRDLRRLRDGAAAADPAPGDHAQLKDLLTLRHLENMAKIILLTGMMVGFAYGMEFFIAWYGGNEYERSPSSTACFGPYCLGLLDDGLLQRDGRRSSSGSRRSAEPVRC